MALQQRTRRRFEKAIASKSRPWLARMRQGRLQRHRVEAGRVSVVWRTNLEVPPTCASVAVIGERRRWPGRSREVKEGNDRGASD